VSLAGALLRPLRRRRPSRHSPSPSRHSPSLHSPSLHSPSRHSPSRHRPSRHSPSRHSPSRHTLATVTSVAAPALVAVAACLACYAAGWRGTDWAAQIYRAGQVARYGLVIWSPGWYGGTFPLNYSLIYPLAAAYLGLWPLAAMSAAGAALCFDRLLRAQAPGRPFASWYFAIATIIPVAIGQLPTLTGEAFALGCALSLASYGRRGPSTPGWLGALWLSGGLALGAMAALTTPVAGSFLSLALVAWGLGDVRKAPAVQAGAKVLAGGFVLIASAALPLIFPGAGYFPFPYIDVVVIVAVCTLLASGLLRTPPAVRAGAVLYGLVSILLFVIPTQMGDNDARFGAYIGVPLVLFYMARLAKERVRLLDPRHSPVTTAIAGALAVYLVLWEWAPIAEALGGATDGASSVASYYAPLIKELATLTAGKPARVEIPPTAHHWESAYVAPAFPLARGWERQLDMAYNPMFYRPGPLSAAAYRSWLLANGVSYVALPDAPLDYAATAEAALLRSGTVAGLVPVWHSATWRAWKVTGSAGLASVPGEVTSIRPGAVVVKLSTQGTSVVKVRWSPYWSLPATERGSACLERSPGGWTELESARPQRVELTISVLRADHGTCPPLPGRPGDVPSKHGRSVTDG